MTRTINDLISEEISEIAARVEEFESKLAEFLKHHVDEVTEKNKDVTISVTNEHVTITDVIDGEQVNLFVYFEDSDNIEIVKNEELIGTLESDSDAHLRYAKIAEPFVIVRQQGFEWDGADFLNSPK